jgi:uncharacterized protein YbbC (DUF1343 family)
MRGWTRNLTWSDTGLRWIPTSPNIPHATSPFYYLATGMIGELAGLETGVGGSAAFEVIAAKWVNAESFTRYLRSLEMPGVTSMEFYRGRVQGSALRISPTTPANLTALGIYMLAELNRTSGSKLLSRTSRAKLNIFCKVYGSSSICSQLQRGFSPATIVASWQNGVTNFRAARRPYLLY